MSQPSQLECLLEKHQLLGRAAQIKSLVRPALSLRKRFTLCVTEEPKRFFGLLGGQRKEGKVASACSCGGSKFGGIPDVPAGFDWPQFKEQPLTFLAQLNCAELHRIQPNLPLPSNGMLYFFADAAMETTPDELNGSSARPLVFANNAVGLSPTEAPGEQTQLLPEFPMDFALVSTLPDRETEECRAMQLSADELERYTELHSELTTESGTPWHQFGGYPTNIQGDVRIEFDWTPDTAPGGGAAQSVKTTPVGEWQLLLQLDSDDDLNVMWGDAGTIYFGIRETDLRAGHFDRAAVAFQCC